MFQCGVSGQDRVVRLDDSSGYLKSSGKGIIISNEQELMQTEIG